ncbi:MAG: NAD(P)/FAD-dependent oxidoreductase [Lachnospiraceae bacterium]|nr:NAD(P)/FAD-dependent oxidoreductase [Lachnospiraceae bacterium]
MKKRVLVVGAGASGLAAAITAAREGAQVTVLEAEDKPCKKLLRTGGGRCNLANAADPASVYDCSDPSFPIEVLSNCSVEQILAFFRSLGVESRSLDGWYYPASEEAKAVADALLAEARRLGVKLKFSERVTALRKEEDGTFTAETASWHYQAEALILACGTPAGLKESPADASLTDSFGLKRAPHLPALVPLRAEGMPCKIWAGVRVRAKASLYTGKAAEAMQAGKSRCAGKEAEVLQSKKPADEMTVYAAPDYTEAGQIQFISTGISGIPIFNLSIRAGRALKAGKAVTVCLDFLDGLDADSVLQRLSGLEEEKNEKERIRLLRCVLPEKLAEAAAVVMKKKKCSTEEILRAFPVKISGTGTLAEAQAAGGGVLTAAVSPETMMTEHVPGLYLTGEILEPVGHCGGFNLQFAWAGGILAGKSASV